MTTRSTRTSRKKPLHKQVAPQPLIIESALTLEEKLAVLDEIRKRDAEQPLEEALSEWEAFKKGIDEHRLPGSKLYENP
jgi:hypothetical protein